MAPMPKKRFTRGQSTYICQICHRETRDTGKGERHTGLCWKCMSIAEQENAHLDGDHEELEFRHCATCLVNLAADNLLDHLPYFTGEKSFPTI